MYYLAPRKHLSLLKQIAAVIKIPSAMIGIYLISKRRMHTESINLD